MLSFAPPAGPLRIVCLGAHCDDVEIGAGATLLRLLEEHPGSEVTTVVATASAARRAEAEAAAAAFAGTSAHRVVIGDLPENVLPGYFAEVKSFVVAAVDPGNTDLVFAPRTTDKHQDHRLLAELAGQIFRDHPVLRYEIVKYDADLGAPDLYVGLEDRHVERKIALLLEHFGSQRARPWFDAEVFRALLRIRGVECNRRWAEGFEIDKLAWLPPAGAGDSAP